MSKKLKKLKYKDISALDPGEYDQLRDGYYKTVEGIDLLMRQYRHFNEHEQEAFRDLQKAMLKLDHLGAML